MRLDPLNLTDKSATINVETARFENTEVGKCPVCHIGMETAEVQGINCYVCVEHCICLPQPDEQQ